MSLKKTEKDNNKKKTKNVSFFKLFRFATIWELILIFIACIFALIHALAMPAVILIYSEFVALLVDRTYGIGTTSDTWLLPLVGGGKILTNATREENYAEIYNDSVAYGILLAICSIILFVTGIFYVDILNFTALKQVTRIRYHFFHSIITQDIGWHDITRDQNFAVRITDDIEKIRDGISEKFGHFMNLILGFLVTLCVSIASGWKLTLAVSVYIPIVIIVSYYVTKYQSKLTIREMNAYAKASSIIEEILSGVRTVIAFNGEEKERKRYEDCLVPARKAGQWKSAFAGFSEGFMRFLLFVACAAGFWYGTHLILDDRDKEVKEYTPAILMITFFGIVVGADNIARSSPFLEAFAMARGSATTIYGVIDTVSKINPLSTDGKILNYGLKGDIEFQDVFFKYPSREDVIVHRGINFKVENGQTVALVGSSGCGKSTCIQLIQRFYDPTFGQVLLDGVDIKKYNLAWLRSNIAIVGQEPVLFLGTIAENIRYGKPGATQKEIEEAAKAAGVHSFIADLPESYNTLIGEKGTQLSGGQKQRIAIARALIQNPKILLLDEATSALDYYSEKQVQEALDLASKGRTTIVVSHRLSAIKHADKIVHIDKGKVVEEGTHEELMKMNGGYCSLVTGGDLEQQEEPEKEKGKYRSQLKLFKIRFFIRFIIEIMEDDPYAKSFDLDVNNLQDHHEQNHNHVQQNHYNQQVHFLMDSKKPEKNEVEEEPSSSFVWTFLRILGIAKPEWPYMILGTIAAGLFGCTYSVFGILFGDFYAALALPERDEVLSETSAICVSFLGVGVAAGVISFLYNFMFNSSAVWLTTRVRSRTLKAVLNQEMAWFDREEQSVGALSARLAGDSASLQASMGFSLSGIIQSISNFIMGVSIAMYYSWRLALVCLTMVPIIVGSVVFEAKYTRKSILDEKTIIEKSTAMATEAITNIRTIAGLRREKQVIDKYSDEVQSIEKMLKKKLRLRGLINSFGQSIPFAGYAAALCYGGVLVSEGRVPFQNIIKVCETLLYGSMMLAQCLAFLPAFTVGVIAAQKLFIIMDRKPRIHSLTEKTFSDNDDGDRNVYYKSVSFRYPKRPDIPVLQGLNLDVFQGKTVALVGSSGCGKSTCIQLLQRFYEPDAGQVLIGKKDVVTDISLTALRSQLGIVSQEPVLFEKTLAENIAYGDNSREVSMTEITDAAKMANIHTFITSLPLGYETCLGSMGTQLSGGEKQRIAIARALIRNPKILLLDEATSALDIHSEKIVQAALDLACSGRTCVVIAHRLSTVQNADVICVIHNGRIVEQGKHHQLLAKGGIYAKLHKMQSGVD
ncbi:multidrug resistance protein homolog 65-like isoform X1 [Hermetia illucens]|uniref:multidrug resistance protein homolog 65-like isoform X1 n=1 Tax=Hermetia illucens TaxID=343691 RepID=UPI0018CC2D66|nr:multidrug resistance protein homolog 65-like isoform X1 [Hermetia illucens]